MTYLTYDDIATLTDVPVNTLRQWVLRGKMPKPDLRPSPKKPLWYPETIDNWLSKEDIK